MNRKATMTGGQDVPDVIPLLTSVFGDDCTVLDVSGLTPEQAREELQKLFQAPGLKICAVKGECPPTLSEVRCPLILYIVRSR